MSGPARPDHITETLPGVQGAVPEVDAFAVRWCERRDVSARVVFEQGIYMIREIADVPRAEGACRPATDDDHPVIISWFVAFSREALNEVSSAMDAERQLRRRLESPAAGFRVWQHDGEVRFAATCLRPSP